MDDHGRAIVRARFEQVRVGLDRRTTRRAPVASASLDGGMPPLLPRQAGFSSRSSFPARRTGPIRPESLTDFLAGKTRVPPRDSPGFRDNSLITDNVQGVEGVRFVDTRLGMVRARGRGKGRRRVGRTPGGRAGRRPGGTRRPRRRPGASSSGSDVIGQDADTGRLGASEADRWRRKGTEHGPGSEGLSAENKRFALFSLTSGIGRDIVI